MKSSYLYMENDSLCHLHCSVQVCHLHCSVQVFKVLLTVQGYHSFNHCFTYRIFKSIASFVNFLHHGLISSVNVCAIFVVSITSYCSKQNLIFIDWSGCEGVPHSILLLNMPLSNIYRWCFFLWILARLRIDLCLTWASFVMMQTQYCNLWYTKR